MKLITLTCRRFDTVDFLAKYPISPGVNVDVSSCVTDTKNPTLNLQFLERSVRSLFIKYNRNRLP